MMNKHRTKGVCIFARPKRIVSSSLILVYIFLMLIGCNKSSPKPLSMYLGNELILGSFPGTLDFITWSSRKQGAWMMGRLQWREDQPILVRYNYWSTRARQPQATEALFGRTVISPDGRYFAHHGSSNSNDMSGIIIRQLVSNKIVSDIDVEDVVRVVFSWVDSSNLIILGQDTSSHIYLFLYSIADNKLSAPISINNRDAGVIKEVSVSQGGLVAFAFAPSDSEHNGDIYVYDRVSKELIRLTETPKLDESNLEWSKSEENLYYLIWEESALYVIRRDGTCNQHLLDDYERVDDLAVVEEGLIVNTRNDDFLYFIPYPPLECEDSSSDKIGTEYVAET